MTKRPKKAARKPSKSGKPSKKQLAEKRSRAAKLGWKRRRAKEREDFIRRSKASSKGHATRKFRKERVEQGPPLAANVNRAEVRSLRMMIEKNEPEWRKWLEFGLKLGKSMRDIRNEWFSPKYGKEVFA